MNKTSKDLPVLHIHDWEYPETKHHKLIRKCKSCPVVEELNKYGLPKGTYPAHIQRKRNLKSEKRLEGK